MLLACKVIQPKIIIFSKVLSILHLPEQSLLRAFSTTRTVSDQTDNFRNTKILRCKNSSTLSVNSCLNIGLTKRNIVLHKLICIQKVADFLGLFVGCSYPLLHIPSKFSFHSGRQLCAYRRGRFLVPVLVTIFFLLPLAALQNNIPCHQELLQAWKNSSSKTETNLHGGTPPNFLSMEFPNRGQVYNIEQGSGKKRSRNQWTGGFRVH